MRCILISALWVIYHINIGNTAHSDSTRHATAHRRPPASQLVSLF